MVAVSGVKNAGKTTLITAMLPHLAAAGLKVATVKHDGHSFPAEPEGTDTGRHLAAGAWGAAIFDGEKYKMVRRDAVDEEALIARFSDADLVLLEGFKHSRWPKLELVRAGVSQTSVCDPSTLLALATDQAISLPGVPTIPLEGEAAARVVLGLPPEGGAAVTDGQGRSIDYLRLSVTDRCNLRCVYCMPPEGVAWTPHGDILSYEEILRLCRLFARLGVRKVRLTGGEPLTRKGLPRAGEGPSRH